MAVKMDQVGAWVGGVLIGGVIFVALLWSLGATKSPVERLVDAETPTVISELEMDIVTPDAQSAEEKPAPAKE